MIAASAGTFPSDSSRDAPKSLNAGETLPKSENTAGLMFFLLVIAVSTLTSGCTVTTLSASPKTSAITVDTGITIKDVSENPIGINLNFLVDDDAHLETEVELADALAAIGVHYLRYPGGEKSDAIYWTLPPWPKSPADRLLPGLARTGPREWPANSPFVSQDMKTFIPEILDFNEFMALCQKLECQPVVVVAADSFYIPPSRSGTAPSRDELIQSATEWVRYANLTMGYGIEYWMIGNETWNVNFNGGTNNAENYANDIRDFSISMRSVDPTIKIIANGRGSEWWETILTRAAQHVDYLGISAYPTYGWAGYDTYEKGDPPLDAEIEIATSALKSLAPSPHATRIQIAITETNAINFAPSGWNNNNDIGHALVLFEVIGTSVLRENVAFIQCWTTRWLDVEDRVPAHTRDLIDGEGQLQATGSALSIWGRHLLDDMLSSHSTGDVKAYSSMNRSRNHLNVFLLNKHSTPRAAEIQLLGHQGMKMFEGRSFHGRHPADSAPMWSKLPVLTDQENLSVVLPPLSINVIHISRYKVR